MLKMFYRVCVLCFITLIIHTYQYQVYVYASIGDQDSYFQSLLHYCQISHCQKNATDMSNFRIPNTGMVSHFNSDTDTFSWAVNSDNDTFSWAVKAPWWTCEDSCKFQATNTHAKLRRTKGHKEVKYYGHWAFYRLCGLEEFASVIFSLGNALAYLLFLLQGHFHRCKLMLVRVYTISGLCSWLSSALYHSYKTYITSACDFSFALTFIYSSFLLSVFMVTNENLMIVLILVGLTLPLIIWRLFGLWTLEVSFDQHMNLCIFILVFSHGIWLFWLLKQVYFKKNQSKSGICLFCVLGFVFAASFEVFDFPPLWELVDAHALWHLLTIPIAFAWNFFWIIYIQEKDIKTA